MPPTWLFVALTLSAWALAVLMFVLGAVLARSGRERLAKAEQRVTNTVPTTITVTRAGVAYPCRWVRFVAVMPAELGDPREDDEVTTTGARPPRTELTLVAAGDVRELFEVVP